MSIKTLNYLAPINPLGYGQVGLNLFLELSRKDVDIKLWPIGGVDCPEHAIPLIKEAVENRCMYEVNAPSLRVWHQNDLALHVGKGVHIGYPIFELDRFTEDERMEMASMDMLFVCSHWAKEVVCRELPHDISPDDVVVIPLGVCRNTFNHLDNQADPRWTTFLNVGKWEYRKGHDVIAEVFSKAFEPKDRVRLWMMNHNPFLSEQQTKEWEHMYKSSPMGDKINFLPRVKTHGEVAKVMSEADCGVFPARAEGWNLELLEMMAMGKQVITTNYSAHTEFCTRENAYLIDIDEMEDAYDGVFFDGESGGQWAKLGDNQIDAMVEAMRAVHKKKELNEAGIQTSMEFSWERAAQKIIELDHIWG